MTVAKSRFDRLLPDGANASRAYKPEGDRVLSRFLYSRDGLVKDRLAPDNGSKTHGPL